MQYEKHQLFVLFSVEISLLWVVYTVLLSSYEVFAWMKKDEVVVLEGKDKSAETLPRTTMIIGILGVLLGALIGK